MFKRSRRSNISIFIVNQGQYELPRITFSANGILYHIFKPNNSRDIQHFYEDKASMDLTINEIKILKSICWKDKYQPLTIDWTKDKYIGRFSLGLISISVPDKNRFKTY